MKKYKVTYEMRYIVGTHGISGVIGQYITEFSAEPEYSFEVAEALRPTSTRHLRWMIDSIEEVMA